MEKEINNNTQLVFDSLTPFDDSELGVYETALDYVFNNPDIKNVALSGAYGAGKSSVLASYKKKSKNKERMFLHISLAHFEDDNASKENGEIKESVLEGKILNQLIHQIPEGNIPQTNFRVKSTTPQKDIIKYSVIFTLLILLILHLTLSSTWKSFITSFQDSNFKDLLSLSTSPYAYLSSGIALCGIIAFLTYQGVKLQKNRRIFKRLNLQGNEIELFEESNDSYFDKYLNEVLYLFENAGADVIVFEDMDRFDANQIFERLREVNTLINMRSRGRIIRFFYLLKDDIFTSKDRTKFFDFIIPVVPVVDSSNSYDQFISQLQKNSLVDKFDERFLKGLSLYVDEMRLLKNICNEFLIYYNRLNVTELDYSKMLALITYKNLFPRDFSELQLGRGFVHVLFEKKDSYIRAEAKILESSITEIEEKIKRLNSEVLSSTEELSIVYGKKREPYSSYYSYRRDTQKELDRLNTEEQTRRKQIEDRQNGKIAELQKQLDQKKKELTALKSKPLYEIINRDNVDRIFQEEEINEIGDINQFLDVKSNTYFPLLKYLIRNGYIDETYSDYMTYFYENSLCRTDKIFLRSVADRKAKDYQYGLKEPQKVLEQLDEYDFDQEEVLNYSLTDYLMKSDPECLFVKHLLCQLREKKKYDFIFGYLNVSRAPVEFVRQCNLNWNTLFQNLIIDNALSEERLNYYALLTLYSSDKKTIESTNIDDCLTNYISESTSFLDVEQPEIDCLIKGFALLNVLFNHLEYSKSNKNLFMAVYQNNLYAISYENLREILKNIYGIVDDERIIHGNYSAIYALPCTPIQKYVETNIVTYAECMFDFCDGAIADENDAAAAFLNNPQLTQEQKIQYIKCLHSPLSDLSTVEDTNLWPILINYGAVTFSEKNVLEYYKKSQEGDQSFARLINSAERIIDFKELVAISDREEIDRLFGAVTRCDEIEDEKYEQCVVSFNRYYRAFSIADLSIRKVLILIKHNVIRMNSESLTFMRNNYSGAIYEFIYRHADEYISLIDKQLFDHSEMLQFLSMDVNDKLKLKLLMLSTEPVSVLDKGYSSTIVTYILTNNLDASDMPALFGRYEAYSKRIKEIILNYTRKHPEILKENIDCCSLKLSDDFFTCSEITLNIKSSILSSLIPRLDKEKTIEYLNAIGLTEFVKIFDSRARPKYEIKHENEELLDAFVDKGWIFEYIEDPDREGYYKIHRRNPNKALTIQY